MPWFFLSGMRSRMCSRTVEEGSTNRPESADRIVRQARRNTSRNAHDGGATHSSRGCGTTGRRPRCPERPTVHGRTAAGATTRGRPGRCGPVGCARHDPIPPAAAGGASPPERAGRRGVAVPERCRHGSGRAGRAVLSAAGRTGQTGRDRLVRCTLRDRPVLPGHPGRQRPTARVGACRTTGSRTPGRRCRPVAAAIVHEPECRAPRGRSPSGQQDPERRPVVPRTARNGVCMVIINGLLSARFVRAG